MLAFQSNSMKSQTSCPPPSQDCLLPQELKLDVNLNGFVGFDCPMSVIIKYCVDKTTNPFTIKVSDWDPNYDDIIGTACGEKLDQLLKAHLDGSGAEYSLWYKDFQIHVGNAVLEYLVKILGTDVPPCAGGGAITGHFYMGSCVSPCIGSITIMGKSYNFIGKGDCSTDICCYINNTYCIEAGNVKVLTKSMSNVVLPGQACKKLNNLPIQADCTSKRLKKEYAAKIKWLYQKECSPVCEITKPKIAFNYNQNVFDNFIDFQTRFDGGDIDISIFPNPITSNLNVYFSNEFSGNLSLLDMVGREVLNQKIANSYHWQYNFIDLESGIYIVKLASNNNIVATKKIKIVK
jgi:hypothetical protein